MNTLTAEKKSILNNAITYLKAIRDGEIDGTERRQIEHTGYDMKDILGYEKIGQTMIDVSHYGADGYALGLDEMIAEVEAALAA